MQSTLLPCAIRERRKPFRQARRSANLWAAVLFFAISLCAGQNLPNVTILQGKVRDPHGAPVAAATVSIQAESKGEPIAIQTDDKGQYRFPPISQGSYLVRASKPGFQETSTPVTLSGTEKNLDLVLTPESKAPTGGQSDQSPQFFDEPHFTVAGVTQTGNAGGHGSDVVLRSTEALTKATLSLAQPQAGTSAPIEAL